MELMQARRVRARVRRRAGDPQSSDLNTAQSIARVLREQIHCGKLAPSTRLTQRDLAAQFGHSPMPARDAVKILLTEGLVVQEGSKTIVVAPITLRDFDEIMEMRMLLEPRALELSIPRLTSDDIAEIRALMARSNTTDEPREIVNNHWSFHRALYRRAERPRLQALIEQQHNLLVRYLLPNWTLLGIMRDWAHGEQELVDMIEQQRISEAVAWLRRDLEAAALRVIRPSIQ